MEGEKLQNELDEFKKHLVLQHSLREITIKNHLGNIKRMLQKLQTTNPEKEEVTNYVYEIRNSDKSPSHQCNNIASVEKYMDFKKKLVRYAKPKRLTNMITDVLTEAEVSRLIRACKNIKEIAMMITLAFTGARNRGFCNIKVKDVDFGNNSILITKSKGRKEYPACIPSDAVKILIKYIEEYPRKYESYLFTTKDKGNQYTTSDIRKFVKTVAKRAGIDKRVYPNLLRHSLASNMRLRGADIFLIKEQLGQDWIESTMIYISRISSRIKVEYEVYKPAYL